MEKAIIEERSKSLDDKLKELEDRQMNQQDYINMVANKQDKVFFFHLNTDVQYLI